jgi:cell division protein FtsB
MAVLSELRRRARQIVGPVLAISLVAYFAYHLVQGDRGIFALWQLQAQLRTAQATKAALDAENAPLAHKVALLRGDRLDRDMLDQQVRAVLGYAEPDEIVIFNSPPTD